MLIVRLIIIFALSQQEIHTRSHLCHDQDHKHRYFEHSLLLYYCQQQFYLHTYYTLPEPLPESEN